MLENDLLTIHVVQVLVYKLGPGAKLTTEPGTFLMGSKDIETELTFDSCCMRYIGGESCVNSVLTNGGEEDGHVGLTSNRPAKILPVDLGKVRKNPVPARTSVAGWDLILASFVAPVRRWGPSRPRRGLT